MSRFTNVAVIGAGAWGTALANAAAAAGRAVTLHARDPDTATALATARENVRRLPGIALGAPVTPTADPEALGRADLVLLVVPTQAVRATLAASAPHLAPGVPIVSAAKGLERGSALLPSAVIRAVRPDGPVAALSGPSFAADVARGLPTAVSIACPDGGLAAAIAGALSGPTFRLYHGTDLTGVEIGGAAKNVLAIAAGMVEGRRLGESAKAALVARGFAELVRFAVARGARPETPMGLSGLGDLVLTCASPQSRNFALGLRLGRGEPAGLSEPLAEGAWTAETLAAEAAKFGIDMPVAAAVADVLAGRLTVAGAAEALMARPLRAEG